MLCKSMNFSYGERLQELEKEIIGKLGDLGIINVKFYFPDNLSSEDRPYVRYKMTKSIPIEECEELRRRITTLITRNFSDKVRALDWGRDTETLKKNHRVYLELFPIKIENPEAMNHGLLSLVNQELRNYNLRR